MSIRTVVSLLILIYSFASSDTADVCGSTKPVGVSDTSIISDSQLTASSWHGIRFQPAYGRLNGNRGDGWCAKEAKRTDDWLQVDLGKTIQVCAVATQGDTNGNEWTTDLKLSYSSDGKNWTTYKDLNGTEVEFHRSGNSNTITKHALPVPVKTRYIRFHPFKQHNWNCLRVEVYGNVTVDVCTNTEPVGVSDTLIISDSQLTASSWHGIRFQAAYGRLNGNRGDGWCAKEARRNDDWLQVDLGKTIQVCAVATQGDINGNEWTTDFKLSYSSDGNIWTTYKDSNDTEVEFHRSGDSNTIDEHVLPVPVTTRYIRFHPFKQHNWNCLRVEVFGAVTTDVCSNTRTVGVYDTSIISDNQLTASSRYSDRYLAAYGRLNGHRGDGWCAKEARRNDDWLQIDLGNTIQVCAVATQGDINGNEWTTDFRLSYSSDGNIWTTYKDSNGTEMEFHRLGDSNIIDNHVLPVPVNTRYIRFHPFKQHNWNCLRVEVYGNVTTDVCNTKPVGISDTSIISDSQLTASSRYGIRFQAAYGRLNGNRGDGWCAQKPRGNDDWLQVDLGKTIQVCAVATQGDINGNEWTTDFKLSYSFDGNTWTTFKDSNNTEVEFHRSGDSNTIDKHVLPMPVKTRYIRFHPFKQHNWNCLRVEVFGAGCTTPFGMENGAISDAQISASSKWDGIHPARNARLNFKRQGEYGWTTLRNDYTQWLQVDLGNFSTVTGIATQGSPDRNKQWVTKYILQYSEDGVTLHFYKEPTVSSAKEFVGNVDADSIVYNVISPPITARFIRIRPLLWQRHIGMRIELYGCPVTADVCSTKPVGISDTSIIPDNQLTASSWHGIRFQAAYGRLNGNRGDGWCAKEARRTDDWLQVDLGKTVQMCAVATQGDINGNEWTTDFNLSYSFDGNTWTTYKDATDTGVVFHRSGDSNTIDKHVLPVPVKTRYIRFHPLKQHNWNCLRVEVFGVGCTTPLGMENAAISDAQINASSQWDDIHPARNARLNFKRQGEYGWTTLKNDHNQWLQVVLGNFSTVTGIATQGSPDRNKQWVTKYTLQYSDDGVTFHIYKEPTDSSAKVFVGNVEADSIVYNVISPPIISRYIRILPLQWQRHIGMRIELYGCPARQSEHTVAASNAQFTKMKSSTNVLPTTLNPSLITSSNNVLAAITTSSVVTSQSRISEMASSITLHHRTSNLPEITPSYDIEKESRSPTITNLISQNREITSTTTSSKMTTMMTSAYAEMPVSNEQSKKSGQTDDEQGFNITAVVVPLVLSILLAIVVVSAFCYYKRKKVKFGAGGGSWKGKFKRNHDSGDNLGIELIPTFDDND